MKIFFIFALLYAFGRQQVKASIFSLKGMLAFLFLAHTEGVLQQGRLFSHFPD